MTGRLRRKKSDLATNERKKKTGKKFDPPFRLTVLRRDPLRRGEQGQRRRGADRPRTSGGALSYRCESEESWLLPEPGAATSCCGDERRACVSPEPADASDRRRRELLGCLLRALAVPVLARNRARVTTTGWPSGRPAAAAASRGQREPGEAAEREQQRALREF